ncbi:MAG: phosphoribosylformylglycinamidine cyclo-ligase [Leptospiraceae bacterium]|nr:phosphoribosylformylglycinamidine cyclo-ligase [Leptospiraceae bacterium]MDW8307190.1 phosphoribosylformylglycinamidine cyclo-ligase [Leptospiraceae bacterium]
MDYKSAGVDTEKARRLLQNLRESIGKTHGENPAGKVIGSLGGFSGVFEPKEKWRNAHIVATTDGVGTKIELIRRFQRHSTVGFDLVAMCVNDLYCAGATPAFFLDYIACGKLSQCWYESVLKSIAKACELVPMALLGGETAEHPGVMEDDEYDLAGFCVGFVESSHLLPKLEEIKAHDVLIGLPSSGLHSNGFSLVRKILNHIASTNSELWQKLSQDEGFIEKLLYPTRIYNFIPQLLQDCPVKAIAHITGGGFYENIPRILPRGFEARITEPYLFTTDIFHFIEKYVSSPKEMFSVFNMGVGMILVGSPEILSLVRRYEQRADVIGILEENKSLGESRVLIKGIDF